MTKIDIISGFLGAGKTTLIKKLIKEAFKGEQIVLIENEFGEIGIDGGFLKDAGVNITEMNSGCICCSLVGDFGKALKEVMDRFAPTRIIIEPSGVGKLSDVRRAVQDVAEDCDITVNSLVTVADVKKVKMYMKNFGEFYNNQVESAGTIILSRTQDVSQDKLDAAVAMIREKNQEATIITTPWDDLTGVQILGAMEKSVSLAEELMAEEDVCPVCGHHHDHDEEHEHHHHDHDHEDMIMRNMSIITTMIMRSMSIIITTMIMRNTNITIMTMSITIITTMPMRCSPAGEKKRHASTQRMR